MGSSATTFRGGRRESLRARSCATTREPSASTPTKSWTSSAVSSRSAIVAPAALIQAQAHLIGHHLAYAESGALPVHGDRRAAPQRTADDAAILRVRLIARSVATGLDAVVSLGIAGAVAALMDISFWPVAGVITVMYYTGMTIAFGVLPGLRVVEALRHRLPSLFDVADSRRAHA